MGNTEIVAEILRRGVEAGEVREDVAIEHIADLLTEIHLAYADRVMIVDAPLDPALSGGILACMLTGALVNRD